MDAKHLELLELEGLVEKAYVKFGVFVMTEDPKRTRETHMLLERFYQLCSDIGSDLEGQ